MRKLKTITLKRNVMCPVCNRYGTLKAYVYPSSIRIVVQHIEEYKRTEHAVMVIKLKLREPLDTEILTTVISNLPYVLSSWYINTHDSFLPII